MEPNDLLAEFTADKTGDENKQMTNPWNRSSVGNDYDFGSMYAGISISEITAKDFLAKIVNMMSAMLKNERPKANHKILDLLKIVMDMYVSELSIKSDDIHANAKVITAFQGLVQSYVENSKLKERL